ncbi:MAG TPA: Ig-like domain repeat protein, partial [Acidobacteriaceae bacterium]
AAVLPILTFCSVLAHAQGTTPSQTDLQQSGGSVGQASFLVTVRPGVAAPTPSPSGTIKLYNGANPIGSPATLSWDEFGPGSTFAQIYGMPDPAMAAAASGSVWGDFNEDSRPDVLVYGNGSGAAGQPGLVVQTFLSNTPPEPSNGLGLFTPVAAQQLPLPLQTQYGQTLAVLDVDGDGHLDLLAGNTVAYGKGDGTFGRVAVLPILGSGYSQTYAADIDGDGKMDIVAVDTPPSVSTPGTVQYAFTVFHNAGGGSFTAMGPYPLAPSFAAGSSVAYNIFGLSFADVNGDGRMDILSQSNAVPAGNAQEPAMLNILLNLGTGFAAPKTIDTSAIPYEGMVSTSFSGPILTDLNNDTKQDLVFSYQANTGNNGVATLLGHGDGTFAAPVNFVIGSTLAVGSPLLPLITDDPSSFGNTDVILGSGVLLRGNGDGTVTAGTPLFTSAVAPGSAPPVYALLGQPPYVSGVARDLNVTFINLHPGANAFFSSNQGSVATLTAMLAPGTYSLTAHYSGDATYAPSVSNTFILKVPTVAVTSSANPSYTGEDVTLTATITDLPVGQSGSVVFSDGTTVLGTAPVNTGVASFKTNFSTAGSHTITATYSGDPYAQILAARGSVTQTVDAPTVTITSSANPMYASQPVTFTATLSDPTITGSITFVDISKNGDNPLDPMAGTTESTLGTGTLADGVATLTTKLPVGGSHTILAVYGPDIYAPIAQAQLTETVNLPFAVNVSNTSVSLTASSGQTATATLPVQALGGFTGPVTFSCQGQPTCTFSPATVNLSGTGTVNVTLTVTAVAVTNTADTGLRSMALACGLPLFALVGFAGRGRRRRILLLVFGAALCVIPFTGCGGGGSSSPAPSNGLKAGTYPFYITATSGQNVQVLQGMLTVQ